jgi:cytoskeletal protein RodZ
VIRGRRREAMLEIIVLLALASLPLLGLMWWIDARIKRSQGTPPSQLQRGFEVKQSNPVERDTSAGTETKQSED